MRATRRQLPDATPVPRTIRFPPVVRARLVADSERCGRSFEAQVIAILRRHYGEDVDIAPSPDFILSLAQGSLTGLTEAEKKGVTQAVLEDLE